MKRFGLSIYFAATLMMLAMAGVAVACADDKKGHVEEQNTINLTEEDIAYEPEEIVVHAGQVIKLHNKDPFAHKSRVTRHLKNGVLGKIAVKDHTEKPDTTFTFQLKTPGVYEIRCMLHDGMAATIKVVE